MIDCCCFTPLCRNSNGSALTVGLELCDFAPRLLLAHLLYSPLSVYRSGSCVCLRTQKLWLFVYTTCPIEVVLSFNVQRNHLAILLKFRL